MACRLGACEINNNRAKPKKSAPKSKKGKVSARRDSSSDWSDSDDSCSGCSACCGSSSICSCSECNLETDSSDSSCCGAACGPKPKKKNTKAKNRKDLRVCEWVAVAKKAKKPSKAKKVAAKSAKPKRRVTTCYECC